MKQRTEILQLLSNYKPVAKKKYGLTRIGIFGSVARGEQTEQSDVDVCYEGKAPSTHPSNMGSEKAFTAWRVFKSNTAHTLAACPIRRPVVSCPL